MSPTDPTVAAPKKLMTANEFWDFCQRPENQDMRHELIRGEIIEMSRPTRHHGIVMARIGDILSRWLEQTSGVGYVAVDAGLVLEDSPGTVVGPDVAYYTDAATFEEVPPKWGEDPPVLVVEVLSPNDKKKDVTRKVADYLDNGVPLVWVVDYEERFVTVYRLGQPPRAIGEDDELTGGDDLPGFSCRVAEFFRLPGGQPLPPLPKSS
ncbi:MAG TPA: Uma2 family endonuclease [Fimbriiglobus sp.]|nr:Uma2 family endonuclease [Fimbriiglobus sp.]